MSKTLNNISLSEKKFAVVYTEWNELIIEKLLSGSDNAFIDYGVDLSNVVKILVPGAFEIPLACKKIADTEQFSGIVALGCVIRGETTHYDYISEYSAKGIMDISLEYKLPIGYGILTVENRLQANNRAGGEKGNKGYEATEVVFKMLNNLEQF